MSQELPTLVHGLDPLCGWCFGTVDVVREAHEALRDEVRWHVALGGLVTGERVRALHHDEAYLRRGLATVEQVTGRAAGAAYLDGLLSEGTWVASSEPAVRAVVVAREAADDDVAVEVSHRLSDGLYVHGRPTDDPEHLRAVASEVGLDADAFVERWASGEAERATQDEMRRARALGVTTYPSFFLRPPGSDRMVELGAGWLPADELVGRARAVVGALREGAPAR